MSFSWYSELTRRLLFACWFEKWLAVRLAEGGSQEIFTCGDQLGSGGRDVESPSDPVSFSSHRRPAGGVRGTNIMSKTAILPQPGGQPLRSHPRTPGLSGAGTGGPGVLFTLHLAGPTLGSGGFGSRVKSLNTQWVPRRPAIGAIGDLEIVEQCGIDLTFCRDSRSRMDNTDNPENTQANDPATRPRIQASILTCFPARYHKAMMTARSTLIAPGTTDSDTIPPGAECDAATA